MRVLSEVMRVNDSDFFQSRECFPGKGPATCLQGPDIKERATHPEPEPESVKIRVTRLSECWEYGLEDV